MSDESHTDYVVVWSGTGDDSRPTDAWWSKSPHSTWNSWQPGLSPCCDGVSFSIYAGRASWDCPTHGHCERIATRSEVRVSWETLRERLKPTRQELQDLILGELRRIVQVVEQADDDV